MKLLRINMSQLKLNTEKLPDEWTILGGRALVAQILDQEVPPQTDPLSSPAKLVISCGPFAGTLAPSCGRISIGAKSPLTSGIKESNSGGPAGQRLDKLGIRAIIIEGQPKDQSQYFLKISSDKCELVLADAYAGLKNYDLAKLLYKEFSTRISIISIGLAGERQWKAATIALTDNEGNSCRQAARGGLGAVMGAKGVKAIVIDDTSCQKTPLADKSLFKKVISSWKKTSQNDLNLQYLKTYGTPGYISTLNYLKGIPVGNYQQAELAGIKNLAGEHLNLITKMRGGKMIGCMPGCLVNCSVKFNDKKKKFKTSNLQYQTLAMMGTNLKITDPDVVAELDYICDNLGIDSVELGSSLGVAAEAGLFEMGDSNAVLDMLYQVESGTEIGTILGNGVQTTCDALKVSRVPAIRGQAIPAHDPRISCIAGINYATSPMGADHTTGIGYDHCNCTKSLLKSSKSKQVISTMIDSMGFCMLAKPSDNSKLFDFLSGLSKARYGHYLSKAELLDIGKITLEKELRFNLESGFYQKPDQVPQFLRSEAAGRDSNLFKIPQAELDSFWEQAEDRVPN